MVPELNGLRILLVEDQMIVALQFEDALRAAGCETVGPVGTLRSALALAQEESLDGAVLDVNLGDQPTFAVAEVLLARGIPFLFATGYAEAALPQKWRNLPRLTKPFESKELEQLVTRVFGRSKPSSASTLGSTPSHRSDADLGS